MVNTPNASGDSSPDITSQDEPDIKPDPSDMAAVYDSCAELFQSQAPGLFTWKAVGGPILNRALESFYKRPDLPALQWLDEGSASGRIIANLIAHGVPAEQIEGVEISPDQVDLAKRALPKVHFSVKNISKDELGSSKYDIITRHMVDEHLSNEELIAASKNTLLALKPGGTLVVVFTHPDRVLFTERHKIQADGSYVTTFPWGVIGTNYYRTVSQYLEILKEAGFIIVSIEEGQITPDAESLDPKEYRRYMDAGYEGLNVRLAVVAQRPTSPSTWLLLGSL